MSKGQKTTYKNQLFPSTVGPGEWPQLKKYGVRQFHQLTVSQAPTSYFWLGIMNVMTEKIHIRPFYNQRA